MDFDSDFTLTINGREIRTEREMDVINPATGLAFARAPLAQQAELDAAVTAAQAAFPAWKALGWDGRRALLLAAAKALEPHAAALAQLFVREQGRPLAMARGEIDLGIHWIKAVARQTLADETVEDSPARTVYVRHEPLGVVAGIVPWNFPFLLAIWKIAPALISGNTMVLKPSPFTPLCTLKLAEIWRDILPAGVFNVINGENDLGPMMTAHPGFAKISFTGSTATGKRVMEAAALDLKRVTLELGGNDAAIVLPDVDVKAVARKLFFGAFYNSAQVCIATKRLYVHDAIYDAMRDELAELVRANTVGDGSAPGVMFGPVQNKPQYDRVQALIAGARAQGLTIIEGPAPIGAAGYFIPLTLVDNPPEEAAVVQEEAFGPVLPLLRYTDMDDVITRANASEYGLAGAVWTSDVALGIEIANRLETGTVWINDNLQNGPHIPFAGAKQSGLGVENGLDGLREFTWRRTVFAPKPA
ncbi:aldehyde dehydrogenase family protein [Novosphingobium taihuense]|uniref:Acyl-CoA reductase-like NAD-dependent aldehyde dehydrogenase n=1 Tax=Novosphingobium taihuense TaxID=260085 RepID=A0A7W7ET99_9SPHN|nr:aldehyde dehydrogenase family protein [Novosphingobium taihuense]MBB4613037.1 acyl-CoA reductase-like NAD-dependent aldehyde dehydrogenase [Novosphingobium taihuense]TWH85181.1 acyl-CoA reductase-like NAD-dependent aldehyde dehydrogenase [Novosphingobium taihuense]